MNRLTTVAISREPDLTGEVRVYLDNWIEVLVDGCFEGNFQHDSRPITQSWPVPTTST